MLLVALLEISNFCLWIGLQAFELEFPLAEVRYTVNMLTCSRKWSILSSHGLTGVGFYAWERDFRIWEVEPRRRMCHASGESHVGHEASKRRDQRKSMLALFLPPSIQRRDNAKSCKMCFVFLL